MAPTPSRSQIKWPPKAFLNVLGYVQEPRGAECLRDIGRSVEFGGRIYYIFGDTFCFDAKDSTKCIGLTNNTAARVLNPKKPLESEYMRDVCDGVRGLIPELFPFTPEEKAFNDANKADGRRVVLWSFGGMVTEPGSHVGAESCYMFAELAQTKGAVAEPSHGMALFQIGISGEDIAAVRVGPPLVFGKDEPQFGAHNFFRDERTGFCYVVGNKDLKNYLGRIKIGEEYGMRGKYEFWGRGQRWISNFASVDELEPILDNMAQGSVLMPSWAPAGRPYVYIGVGWWMESKIFCATAENVEGPWDIHHIADATRLNETSNFRYCVYPHEWSWNDKDGTLFVTWSEDNPSRVIGAELKFDHEKTTRGDKDSVRSGSGGGGFLSKVRSRIGSTSQ